MKDPSIYVVEGRGKGCSPNPFQPNSFSSRSGSLEFVIVRSNFNGTDPKLDGLDGKEGTQNAQIPKQEG